MLTLYVTMRQGSEKREWRDLIEMIDRAVGQIFASQYPRIGQRIVALGVDTLGVEIGVGMPDGDGQLVEQCLLSGSTLVVGARAATAASMAGASRFWAVDNRKRNHMLSKLPITNALRTQHCVYNAETLNHAADV